MTAARLAVLVALLVATAQPAHADPPDSSAPGSPSGEPVTLAGLRVARETLTLDLRPLALPTPRAAVVEAQYLLVNEGAARRVALSLVTRARDVRDAGVWLDGERQPAQRVRALAVPAAWHVAETTPALDGDPLPYEAETAPVPGLAFVLDVPPGRHLVRVTSRVAPGSYDAGDHPNRVWQVAHSLAPARFWAGFGSLEVTVHAPDAWAVAASLPLRREGDALTATFAGVPGDVLTVSARAPAPRGLVPLRLGGFALALGLCALAGWLGGTVAARRRRPVRRAWLVSLAGGAAGAALLLAATLYVSSLGDSSAYADARARSALWGVGPLSLLAGTLLAQTVARRVHRRAR